MSRVQEVVIGSARLYCADCADVLPYLAKHDLLLTDPPYGITITNSPLGGARRLHQAEAWDAAPISQALLDLAVSRAEKAIVWGGNYYALPPARCFLVWDKKNDGRDFADCEMAWTNVGTLARMFRRHPQRMDGGKQHPAQKPVDLMRWCIQIGGHVTTVLDPFMGSGSAGVACVRSGAAFTGIEREQRYFDLACERIEREVAQGRMFVQQPAPPKAMQVEMQFAA